MDQMELESSTISAPWRAEPLVSLAEAAQILHCATATVTEMIEDGWLAPCPPHIRGDLSRSDVEELATEIFPWPHPLHDPHSYWVTGQDAAEILGIGQQRLDELAAAGWVPHVQRRDGIRLFRRSVLDTLAQGEAVAG
jgi:hypothetical protein